MIHILRVAMQELTCQWSHPKSFLWERIQTWKSIEFIKILTTLRKMILNVWGEIMSASRLTQCMKSRSKALSSNNGLEIKLLWLKYSLSRIKYLYANKRTKLGLLWCVSKQLSWNQSHRARERRLLISMLNGLTRCLRWAQKRESSASLSSSNKLRARWK